MQAGMAADALARSGHEHGGGTLGGNRRVPAAREMRARRARHRLTSRSHSIPLPSRRYYLYMMLPAIIVLACITIYPFFWLIWMSLHDVDVGAAGDKWNDFKNLDPPRPRREVHRTAGCCSSSTAPCAWSPKSGSAWRWR